MITKDNLKYCFENLDKEEIDKTFESDEDFVLMELHTFNTGGVVTLEPHLYDEDIAKNAADNGQLFVDKDDFLMLYQESGAENKELEIRT
jgi:hypothetical protein